jgi:hypothetical protein
MLEDKEINMTGSKIPVLEIEKLTLTKDGRGLNLYSDGDVLGQDTWTGSGGNLPAHSATAWLKINYRSGTSATDYTGYVPVFNAYW